jgi:hypothetical protein
MARKEQHESKRLAPGKYDSRNEMSSVSRGVHLPSTLSIQPKFKDICCRDLRCRILPVLVNVSRFSSIWNESFPIAAQEMASPPRPAPTLVCSDEPVVKHRILCGPARRT